MIGKLGKESKIEKNFLPFHLAWAESSFLPETGPSPLLFLSSFLSLVPAHSSRGFGPFFSLPAVPFLPSCSPAKSVALAGPLPPFSIFDRAAGPYSFSLSPRQPGPSDHHPPLAVETDLEFKSSPWASLFPFDYLQHILTESATKSSGGWILFTPNIFDRKPHIYRSSMSRFHGKTESKPKLAASTSSRRHRPPVPTRRCSGHLRVAPPLFYPSLSPAYHHQGLSMWPMIGTTTSLSRAQLRSPPPLEDPLGELVVLLHARRKKNQREHRTVASGSHLWRARFMAPLCRACSPPPGRPVCREPSASW
jgi:hypothetical protein